MKTRSSHLHPMRRIQSVHFVGIGGAGMSGIAEVLLNQGFTVTGSDLAENRSTRHLEKLGATVFIGHKAEQVRGMDVLVASTAIDDNNPELVAARECRIPVVPRAEMLAELMRFRRGIAVAGTHGKTTTTSLTAALLGEAGLDPTFVVGGLVNALGSNARLGTGEYLVAEADESDGSFLLLQPVVALITNIDRDHLESYDDSFENLKKAFLEFLHHLPFYGVAVLCIDNEPVLELIPSVTRAVVTFGLSDNADIRASNLKQNGRVMSFDLHLPNVMETLPVTLNLPGSHNVTNVLGAIAVAWELGVDIPAVVNCLETFEGIGRRFAEVGELPISPPGPVGGVPARVTVVEDYGHHPSELAATLSAARLGWPDKRLVVVFQPHRYSRTQALFDDFSQVLAESDVLVLTDIYAAGEPSIDGIDSRTLCQSIRARGTVDPILISDVFSVPEQLPAMLEHGDLVLLLGAGSIGHVAQQLRESGFALEAAA
jgi:UDP-N-acetylmuramate--alanine ligase